jgi:hypothetical protein
MLHLLRHVVVGDRHLDVADHLLVHLHLVYLIYKGKTMVHHLCVVEILNLLKQDAEHLVVPQILDEQNLDANQPSLVVVLQFLVDVVVGVELRHLLKMDCCLGEVGVELRHLQRKDYFLDEAQVLLELRVQHHLLHGLLHGLLLHALQLLLYLQLISLVLA